MCAPSWKDVAEINISVRLSIIAAFSMIINMKQTASIFTSTLSLYKWQPTFACHLSGNGTEDPATELCLQCILSELANFQISPQLSFHLCVQSVSILKCRCKYFHVSWDASDTNGKLHSVCEWVYGAKSICGPSSISEAWRSQAIKKMRTPFLRCCHTNNLEIIYTVFICSIFDDVDCMQLRLIGLIKWLTDWLTDWMTPWSRVLPAKLVKIFPALCGTRRFISAFTRARHLSLSWATSVQSMPPHPTSWKSILLLFFHPRMRLPSGFFPSGPPTKTLYAHLLSSILATWPAHLILLHLITRMILVRSTDYEA